MPALRTHCAQPDSLWPVPFLGYNHCALFNDFPCSSGPLVDLMVSAGSKESLPVCIMDLDQARAEPFQVNLEGEAVFVTAKSAIVICGFIHAKEVSMSRITC